MKKQLITAFALSMAGSVYAGIPQLNYTCPGNIEVHADEGGPVYINGEQVSIKKSNENYFEATGSGVTVSISINPDGSAGMSYTGKHGANGICQAADFSVDNQSGASAEPSQKAKKACAAKFGGKSSIKTVNALKPGWWEIILTGKKGRQTACTVDDSGKIGDWVEM